MFHVKHFLLSGAGEICYNFLMDTLSLKQSVRSLAKASFSRSGGPGGQNVNKVNTKATLKLCIDEIDGLSEAEMQRIKTVLANRISNEGMIVIASDEENSQRINLERAYRRLENLIVSSAKIPKKRRPTKPGKASKEARLQAKKRQSQKKARRQISGAEKID